MSEESKNTEFETQSTGTTLAYSCAMFADVTASQFFAILVFTFYFVVIGINVIWLALAFTIWAIWNAINDPIMGHFSDKTNTKYGRRKPWIVIGLLPLCIILVLLFTPPTGSELAVFLYFLIIVIAFDTFYTMFSLNQTALFPEMYITLEERAKANNLLQIFSIISLLFAAVFPAFFIPEYTNPAYKVNYIYAGIFTACIVGIAGLIFIKFGIKERPEFSQDSIEAPSLFTSIKTTMKNKSFRRFVIANFMIFYVFGMLPMMNALYVSSVLGESSSMVQSMLLLIAFVFAAIFMVVWRFLSIKLGVKKGHIVSMAVLIFCLLPLLFIVNVTQAFICYAFVGIGLAGIMFFRAVTISTVIDEDELNTGIRSEGSYYGINAFVTRLSTIAIFASITIVFFLTGYLEYDANPSAEAIMGLRILMVVFPAIAMLIGIISMMGFPIDKERYDEMRQEIKAIHEQKKEKVRSS